MHTLTHYLHNRLTHLVSQFLLSTLDYFSSFLGRAEGMQSKKGNKILVQDHAS